jgi:hypothetical protein
MSCCCNKTYKFCKKISACSLQNLKALFKNIPNGTYIIELNFLQSVIKIQMVVVGTTFTITGPGLNENYTYTGRVFNSAGQMVPFVVDAVQYDCFQFDTVIIAGVEGDTDGSNISPDVIIIEDNWDLIEW